MSMAGDDCCHCRESDLAIQGFRLLLKLLPAKAVVPVQR
jgi:hypothetical protein